MQFTTHIRYISGILFALMLLSCPPGPEAEGSVAAPEQRNGEDKSMIYDDHIYEETFHTIQFYRSDQEMTYPIIYFGEQIQLSLEFDELMPLDADFSDIWIGIKNCDAEWKPSNLLPNEFLDGFTYDRIYDYRRSENTRVPYVHYRFQFPNENIRITRTGNFILYAYRDGDENDLLFSRRFIVAGNKVTLIPKTGLSMAVMDRKRMQTVSFDLFPNAVPVRDPSQELEVMVLQNGRWNNAAKNLQPLFATDNKLEYTFDSATEFEGGNEYRMLDIRSTNFYTQMMKAVEDLNSHYHIHLYTDKPRIADRHHYARQDINGNYFVEVMEYPDNDVEADYVMVGFKLNVNEPIMDGGVYVIGRMTDWQPWKEFQMVHNPVKMRYETEVLLKQGFYDYAYVVAPMDEEKLDEKRLEGSHFETENFYTILVYFKGISDRTHELVGISHINYIDQ